MYTKMKIIIKNSGTKLGPPMRNLFRGMEFSNTTQINRTPGTTKPGLVLGISDRKAILVEKLERR